MPSLLQFGNWQFDPNTSALQSGETHLTLEPLIARLLEFLLTHQDELLTHDMLIQHVWDGRHVTDDAVRRAISLLRSTLEKHGIHDSIKTIYKKGYIARFSPANMTRRQDERGPVNVKSSKYFFQRLQEPRWLLVSSAIIVMSLILVAIYPSSITQSGAPTQTPTLAVLPFRVAVEKNNLTETSLALSDFLRMRLSESKDLNIIAAHSTQRVMANAKLAAMAGRHLNAEYVLSGEIDQIDQLIDIHLVLTETRSDRTIMTFHTRMAEPDIFEISESVIEKIYQLVLLNPTLPTEFKMTHAPRYHASFVAQKEFLAGQRLLNSWVVKDAELAITHFQRAIALEPNFALAYIHLAHAVMVKASGSDSMELARENAQTLLDKAADIDDSIGDLYVIRSVLEKDFSRRIESLEKGIKLSPNNSHGYEMLAELRHTGGDYTTALNTIKRAILLDPLRPRLFHLQALTLRSMKNIEEAEASWRSALRIDPDFRSALVRLAQIHAQFGELATSVHFMERAVETDPDARWMRGWLIWNYLNILEYELASKRVEDNNHDLSPILHLYTSDHQLAEPVTLQQATRMPYYRNPWIFNVALHVYAERTGEFNKAAAAIEANMKAITRDNEVPLMVDTISYVRQYLLLKNAGEHAQAAELKRTTLANTRLSQSLYDACLLLPVQAAGLLSLLGEHERASDVLKHYVELGMLDGWWLLNSDPAFDAIRKTPQFADALQTAARHARAQQTIYRAEKQIPTLPNESTEMLQHRKRTMHKAKAFADSHCRQIQWH